ncbi:hypothetical protein [Psychrobacillus sp. NPDC096389]
MRTLYCIYMFQVGYFVKVMLVI